MVKKSNNWNLQEMQETLVKDTEQRISDGFQEIASIPSVPNGSAAPSVPSGLPARTITPSTATTPEASALGKEEPTKGVQTYIPMSMYRRLNDIKLTRRENIAALVSQAIGLWLDVQEGKQKVNKVI